MRRHPSGRPIHRRRVVPLPITREPRDEPLTPGLRRDESAEAIGFHVGLLPDQDDDED
ncbi:hypothetical protein GJ689_24670 [Rhodoplanes serenus]|uniref:Uncharacterized protein n=1 Tax=Rhodoplanes serenus TaxID=200615 RepID=A0A9X4XQ70_9BRAD|nr:hypothetical protein [Rhodoplanes serenus]MTW19388.1 hypothetical protein [Rhodoplanes serenus]